MDDDLFKAAIEGNISAIRNLREKIDQVTEQYGHSILHLASLYGKTECMRFILTEFANKNFLIKLDNSQSTALHLAALRGHVDAVELLINAARVLPEFEKFSRHADKDGDTALHLAFYKNKVEVVKLLVKADPTRDFKSLLYIAAERGYKDIVKVICESCTTPTFGGPRGKTALHAAAGNPDLVELLVNAARRLPEFENFIRQADEDGDTALHVAVHYNKVEVVKLLVKADPNHVYSPNNDSKTPLYIAAEMGYKDIVKVICESCTTPTFDGPQGRTALHTAVQNQDIDSVRLMLEKKKDMITHADSRGWTVFHYAADANSDVLTNTLIEAHKSVVPQAVATEGANTALHIAASKGNISIIMQLTKFYGSSCGAVDENGRNILHIAASKSDREMIQCILQFCQANIDNILNKKDNDGNTPLHLLAIAGCFIPALIEHKGVNRTATNNNNLTPFEALYSNDEEIVADQLKIKNAFESIQGNQGRKNTWPGGSNATWESLVQSSKRMRKDAKFAMAKEEIMKKEVTLYRERTNTQIIVTALITTVTFTVGFTMPGGYHQSGEVNEGLAVLSKKTAFDVFMVADAVALFLSTSSLFLYFISSMYQDPHQVSKLIAASTGLNIVSVIAMMLTFITGTYAVLPHSSALAIAVSVISCLFFPCVIFLLIKLIYDRNVTEKFKV